MVSHSEQVEIPRSDRLDRLVPQIQMKAGFMRMTRSKLIQMWFAVVAVVGAAAIAFGAAVAVSTAVMLLALALAPAAILLMLWPGVQPPTASEVIHGTERRN
jgi:hypothetical protein